MKYTKLFLLLLILSITTMGYAQFSLSGELRTRSIVENGYITPAKEGSKSDFSVDQRTRLNFQFKSEKYSTKVVLQDARLWGAENELSKSGMWGKNNAFDMHEGWVNVALSPNANLKIGRQEWNYDDMTILSNRNWATTGLSYDGVLFQTQNKDKGLSLDLGLSYNNNGSPVGYVDNSDWEVDKLKTMNFLHLKKTINSHSHIAILGSLSGKTDTTDMSLRATGTHGLIAVLNKGKQAQDGLFGSFEGYYQHGRDLKKGSDGNNKNISAYMLVAQLGLRSLNKKLELSVGSEVFSGHDYSNSDTDYGNTRHSFDLQYGKRMPVYGGYMNHFIIQDSYLVGTKGGGYVDPFFKVKYNINKKNIIEATAFSPILSTKVRAHNQIDPNTKTPTSPESDANGNPVFWEGSLGQYFDLIYTYKIQKDIILKAGASYANISDIKNQMAYGYQDVASKSLYSLGANYMGWVMLVIKPTFFESNTTK